MAAPKRRSLGQVEQALRSEYRRKQWNMQGSDWNLASIWEAIADRVGDRDALCHGEMVRSWSEFETRAARCAAVLEECGIGHDHKVAFYSYNGPEYVEATFAAFKVRAIPVNVNYRYTATELMYLFENSEATAVIVDSRLAANLEPLLAQLPLLRLVLQVGDGPLLPGAVRYEEALADACPASRINRSPEDLWFLYTGGTTGMPKGVMWPHRSLLLTSAPTFKSLRLPTPSSPEEAATVAERIHELGGETRLLPAAPLMHGTSAISSWGALCSAGAIITCGAASFDAAEVLESVQRHRANTLTIVGDAFAKPIIAELVRAEGEGEPYDLSSLSLVVSSGVMWSAETKSELMARADVICADLLGSSEGVGFARSVSKRDRPSRTAEFRLGEFGQVFNDAGEPVVPGSGERGLLAVGGPIPIGYYKDPAKTAESFREIGGKIWSVPGDWATVEVDGRITLLGRGSACINTAGEKVFPEEVEETLKTHIGVIDANVVGVPDEKWGTAVVAVISCEDPAPSAAELTAHCRLTLAGYKCPKRMVFVDSVQRGPNGKADYRWAKSVAERAVAEQAVAEQP